MSAPGPRPPTLVVADDDLDIRRIARVTLQQAGFDVVTCENGQEAVERWRAGPCSLLILDIGMPIMDGLTACRNIRNVSEVPIMILTARDSEEDVVAGFEAGADDYISKPFRPKELVARINAILHRAARPAASARLGNDGLELDMAEKRVLVHGQPVPVTPLEVQLLQYLMQRAGQPIEKEDLFVNVWGYAAPSGGLNLIEAAVRRLREKIEADPSNPRYIQTVRGFGYRFGV